MTTLLKTGRTLQLHQPSVLRSIPDELKDRLPEEGCAIFHPPSKALIVRCAGETYLSVPMVSVYNLQVVCVLLRVWCDRYASRTATC